MAPQSRRHSLPDGTFCERDEKYHTGARGINQPSFFGRCVKEETHFGVLAALRFSVSRTMDKNASTLLRFMSIRQK